MATRTAEEVWEPPQDLEEGRRWRREIIKEIQVMQAQLGNRTRRGDPNYQTWRQSAITAMTNRLVELREVKDWLAAQYAESEGNLA